ncbi:MAG: hypothetical protein WBP81_23135 [Solirubrobacteraceae bacterium]
MSDQKLPNGTREVGKERRAPWRVLRVCGCVVLVGAGALSVAIPALAGSSRFAGASVPAQTDVASSGGVVPIRLVCPGGTFKNCVGTVSLRTQKKIDGKIQTLGSANFSIASGKADKVKLKLNAEGRKLLGSGKMTPLAVAASHDGHNAKATRSRKVTLESQAYANPAPSPFY